MHMPMMAAWKDADGVPQQARLSVLATRAARPKSDERGRPSARQGGMAPVRHSDPAHTLHCGLFIPAVGRG